MAFGGPKVSTTTAVLVYRLLSFWLVLVIGWGLWGQLALGVRRGRWNRDARLCPVDAGVVRAGVLQAAPVEA